MVVVNITCETNKHHNHHHRHHNWASTTEQNIYKSIYYGVSE